MVAQSVERFASPELSAEVLPGVLAGRLRLCLGYTEPDGGSDVATCKTRAVRDGEGWIINGSKMFTSNAHNAQYVFLITNTDPDAPKHQSLTMFLVPMDSPGVEVQPIRTVDGDRTNITFYSDVRIDDKYRVGEVNGGWAVLREALNAEHGTVERDTEGLQKIAVMTEHLLLLEEAVDRIAAVVHRRGHRGPPPHRRRVGAVPVGPQRRADGGRGEHTGDVRARRHRADHARRHARPDGHPRRGRRSARRHHGRSR